MHIWLPKGYNMPFDMTIESTLLVPKPLRSFWLLYGARINSRREYPNCAKIWYIVIWLYDKLSCNDQSRSSSSYKPCLS